MRIGGVLVTGAILSEFIVCAEAFVSGARCGCNAGKEGRCSSRLGGALL